MSEHKYLTLSEATQFFIEFYRGEHHFPSKLKGDGYGFKMEHKFGSMATFDGNELTRLVLMAHEKCIRVSIAPYNFRSVLIWLHKRQGREGEMSMRHPTIETAIENFKK